MRLLPAALLSISLLTAQLTPPNPAGLRMGHVHLHVRDAEAQRHFWVEQFGATAIQSEHVSGVKLPGMLILFQLREPTGGTEGTVLDHIGLKTPSLADTLKRLRAARFPVLREFTGSEGFPNAYVMGPDEVKIELQEDKTLTQMAVSHHLHYYVSDPATIRDWYVKTFALQSGKRGAHLAADIAGMNLSFQPFKTPPTIGTIGRSLDHIGFEVDNLQEFCRQLEAKGVKLDAHYRKETDLAFSDAFLTDPLGVSIELTEGLGRF
jgi:catechol 2,3-dioxygenase-like lactoylglutathione lyase family enzyme